MVSNQYLIPEQPEEKLFLPPLDAESLVVAKRGVKVQPLTASMVSQVHSDSSKLPRSATDIIKIYGESSELAKQVNNLPLAIRSSINKARAAFAISNFDQVHDALLYSQELLKELPDNFEKGFLQLSLGVLARQIGKTLPAHGTLDLKLSAWNAFNDTARIGKSIDNGFLQSYAKGYMGALYEQDNRFSEASQLTRSAIFLAQQESNPEILYRWQWQLGRLLNRSGNQQEAITQYKNAIENTR